MTKYLFPFFTSVISLLVSNISIAQPKSGYVTNIEKETVENQNFRKVLYTGAHSQLVVMSLKSGEDIGKETHKVDQFIRIEEGDGILTLNGKQYDVHPGFAVMIPAGTKHNLLNAGKGDMKLYTIYSPPQHRSGTVHKTKTEAQANEKGHEK